MLEWLKTAISWFKFNIYAPLNDLWLTFNIPVSFKAAFITVIAVLLLIAVICIIKPKKRKIIFNENNGRHRVIKCGYNKKIRYPKIKAPKGKVFDGWYTDKNLTEKYDSEVLTVKKTLKLYAKFIDAVSQTDALENVENVENEVAVQPEDVAETTTVGDATATVSPVVTNVMKSIISSDDGESSDTADAATDNSNDGLTVVQPSNGGFIEEEKFDMPITLTVGDIYDRLRCVLLGYERVKAFNKIGVIRKQFIAEMFEKDGKIYLYLAVDPDVLRMKGYNVENFTEREFSIVPCKKVITNEREYEEALKIIDEAMTFNNLVKSENTVKKVTSTEQSRRNGFAFFVKNETVLTAADDYYKFLRATTNCYSMSSKSRNLVNVNNKMLLKIFKKDDVVYLYLALDAEKEGLEYVGYDVNFADTPSMFVIKTADDFVKANALIDKLMSVYEMEKHPERASFSIDEIVQNTCGFGYRIRN